MTYMTIGTIGSIRLPVGRLQVNQVATISTIKGCLPGEVSLEEGRDGTWASGGTTVEAPTVQGQAEHQWHKVDGFLSRGSSRLNGWEKLPQSVKEAEGKPPLALREERQICRPQAQICICSRNSYCTITNSIIKRLRPLSQNIKNSCETRTAVT